MSLKAELALSAIEATPAEPREANVVDPPWDLVIEPRGHLFAINFHEVWRYRYLLSLFVKRDIVTVYKQTILGPIWFVVQPLLTMLVYVLVFGRIAKISTDGIPAPLFYLTGIVIWNYFSESFTRTSTTFVTNANIFGKVYFPRLIVPLSLVTSGLIKFTIQLVLFLSFYGYYALSGNRNTMTLWVLATPVIVLLVAIMGLGCGILYSSLTTKYRDLTFVAQFGIQLMMYATPVIYPTSVLNEQLQRIFWWNPLSHLIEAFRFAFFGEGNVSITGLMYSLTFSLTILALGVVVFNRTERTFMDTV